MGEAIVKVTKESAVAADKLLQIFKERGLTIKGVADKAEINDALLSAITRKERNVTAEILVKLAVALDVSTDYLLDMAAATDTFSLEVLKRERKKLDKLANDMYAQMRALKSGERLEKLKELKSLEEEIKRLDVRIARSSFAPVRVPDCLGNEVVYRPARFVEADGCAVVGDANGSIPSNSVVFYKRNSGNSGSAPYLTMSNGGLRLSNSIEPGCEVLGSATYVLLPAHTCVEKQ